MKEHIAHMVRDRAARYGSGEVFRFRENNGDMFKSYYWSEFTRDIDQVSRSLISLGFGNDAHIGIFSNNRLEWTIADIGILAIRGIVIPFFDTASRSQVKYIVEETAMKVMFVGNQDQLEKASWLLDHTISLEKIILFPGIADPGDERCLQWDDFKKLGDQPRFHEELEILYEQALPTDLATILYTSGTSGEPKGVMLGHDNFMGCFQVHDQRLDITEKDVSLCFLPLSHVFERAWTFYLMYCWAVNVFLENPKEVIKTLPIVNPTVMCTVPRFFEKTHEGIHAEAATWPTVKKRIFDWSLSIGHQSNEYRKSSAKMPAVLQIKYFIAEKLVLSKLRRVFGKNIRVMPCAGAAISENLLRFFHAAGLFVNYGYGATETTATVSCFKNDHYEFESCGTVMPGVTVKFSPEGEIMIKGPTVFRGYYNKPDETARTLKDGWYMSGDQGHFTHKGNLKMTDRLKDLFKTSVGKYVSPQKLETLLAQEQLIEQVVVIGDNRKYVSALIVPSYDKLKVITDKLGITAPDRKMLVSHASVTDIFKQRLDEIQADITPYERVVKFTLLAEPFSIENFTMTSTLKLKRRVIAEQYRDEIELMYSAD